MLRNTITREENELIIFLCEKLDAIQKQSDQAWELTKQGSSEVKKTYSGILTEIENGLTKLKNQDRKKFKPIRIKFWMLKCEALINLGNNYQKEHPKIAIGFYNKVIDFAENSPEHTRISNEIVDRAKIQILIICSANESTYGMAPEKLINYAKCVETTKALQDYAAETKLCSAAELAGGFMFYASNSLCLTYKEQKKVTDLIEFSEQMTKNENPRYQIIGFSQLGDYYIQEANKPEHVLLAQKNYKKVLNLYEKNSEFKNDSACELMIGSAAFNMAVIIDKDREDKIDESSECLGYYRLAADFGHKVALHNLGYKYQHGEDVEVDLAAAVFCYEKAASQNYFESQLNLGYLLAIGKISSESDAVKKGIKWLESAAAGPASVASDAYYYLGVYFHEQDINKSKNYYDQAISANPNNRYALYNRGQIYFFGLDGKPDEVKAIECYERAAKLGLRNAYHELYQIYFKKLFLDNKEKDSHYLDLYHQKMNNILSEVKSLDINDSIENFYGADTSWASNLFEMFETSMRNLPAEELDSVITASNKVVHNKCLKINHNVINSAAQSRHSLKRIASILANNVSDMDTINVVTTIHRLGKLTEQSLDYRQFHQEKLAEILLFVKKAAKNLDRLDAQGVINLIEGLSKLNLKSSVSVVYDLIEKLYQYMYKNIDVFRPVDLGVAIYAATRLDPLSSLINKELPLLIDKIISQVDKLDGQSSANLMYSLAMLDSVFPELIDVKKSKDFIFASVKNNVVERAFSREEKKDLVVEAVKYKSQIELHQIYLSFYYFLNKYPSEFVSLKDKLSALKPTMLCSSSRISNLQIDVTEALKQIISKTEIEKNINTLPVDIYCVAKEKKIIIQVNGPVHYLHDQNESKLPEMTLKSKFHDVFLKLSLENAEVLSVPYYEWQQLKDKQAKVRYLTGMLKAANVSLEVISANAAFATPAMVSSTSGCVFSSSSGGNSNSSSSSSSSSSATLQSAEECGMGFNNF